jgi:hypothetical protein
VADNSLIPLGGDVAWMGTQPPMSPSDAATQLYGMTGIPDIQNALTAAQRGEYLPAFGQGAWGAAQLGSMLYPAARGIGRLPLAEIMADEFGSVPRPGWHGTPHLFPAEEGAPLGRFKNEAIGTGEGHSAYGYGHYVGGAQETGEFYQSKLGARAGTEGNLLEVHILPDEHEFLDWDAKIGEHDSGVIDKLESAKLLPDFNPMNLRGEDLYNNLVGNNMQNAVDAGFMGRDALNEAKRSASMQLHNAGVPGIKYKDQGSRISPFPPDRIEYLRGQVNEAQAALDSHKVALTPEEMAAQHTYVPAHYPLVYQNSVRIRDTLQKQLDFANQRLQEALNWEPTNNYVVFDGNNLRIIGRNGERLIPVDHDPFAGERPK